MKQITHEEAKECLEEFEILISNIHNKSAYDYLTNYITQQEKKDKLLELYRERLSTVYITDKQLEYFKDLDIKIQALEEELK